MARTASNTAETKVTAAALGRQRLRGQDRRAALVHAATHLLTDGGIDAISMDTVAVRAGVSRPLVYKHFANRDELLAEVYRRQAAELDATIAAAVEHASGFEAKLRALLRAAMSAETTHGPIFGPLRRAGAHDSAFRREQHNRDRRTVRFFARLAMTEFDLDRPSATAATSMLLTGIESIRAQWRSRPTAERRQFLEDLYINLVMGGLTSLRPRGDRH
ncbi:MAG: TetR/AcrR family transcriptional regulator [Acidimicrobiales bacterium]